MEKLNNDVLIFVLKTMFCFHEKLFVHHIAKFVIVSIFYPLSVLIFPFSRIYAKDFFPPNLFCACRSPMI